MSPMFVIVVSILVFVSAKDETKTEIIDLPVFRVRGFLQQLPSGVQVKAFLGLPYAQAPVGSLRFQKPQPLKKSDFLFEATKFGHACHQQEDSRPFLNTSENCLTLNIFMPAKATKKLPVYVFIHGGGYNYGFSEIFHNPTMASIFIPNNIILVTFNYRLTHFGFFAWPDKHFPKNLGLWDQNAALRFVKENIEAFGGNPDDITIGGHSAGAASVHAHTISPHSRHLFHKAIEMAGNLASVWSIGDETYHFSEILAKELGCDKCDGEKTKKCLQKLAVEDFWAAKQKLGFVATKPTMNNIYWKPVWDEDFFDGKTMEELTAESPPKPILYGLDAGEAVVFTLNTGNPIASVFAKWHGIKPDDRKKFQKSHFEHFLENFYLADDIPNKTDLIREILELYKIQTDADEAVSLQNFIRFTDFITDVGFIVPLVNEYRSKLKHGFESQFLYIFNFTREKDQPILGMKPPHGSELLFLNGINAYTHDQIKEFKADELRVQRTIGQSLVNFIKTGNPSIPGIQVPELTTRSISFFEIGKKSKVQENFYEPIVQFWENASEKYEFDVITGKPYHSNHFRDEV